MKKVTVSAKTVDEAVESALSQLQTTKEFVNIRVIEEPSKGFLGFGSKKAVVEVELISAPKEVVEEVASTPTAHDDLQPVEQAHQFLTKVLSQMGLDVNIEVETRNEFVLFKVTGAGLGLMIGRRGQTLDSIQYLTNVVANRYSKDYLKVVIDPENYRARREDTLKALADRVAKKVIRTGHKVVLEPMNPAERKVIHTQLQEYAGVSTKSEGEGENRRVVVFPYRS